MFLILGKTVRECGGRGACWEPRAGCGERDPTYVTGSTRRHGHRDKNIWPSTRPSRVRRGPGNISWTWSPCPVSASCCGGWWAPPCGDCAQCTHLAQPWGSRVSSVGTGNRARGRQQMCDTSSYQRLANVLNCVSVLAWPGDVRSKLCGLYSWVHFMPYNTFNTWWQLSAGPIPAYRPPKSTAYSFYSQQ